MIDTNKYTGHTEGKWIMGEHKGRPCISAVEDAETPTWVKSIARGLNPSQTADHALLLDAPLILADYKRLQKRNEWLEEVVALLQEDGVDLAFEGYPLWEGEEE